MKRNLLMISLCCITTLGYSQSLKTLILHSDPYGAEDIKTRLDSTFIFDEVDLFDVSIAPPHVDSLLQYNSVLVYATYYNEVGDSLTKYVNLGGGVVDAMNRGGEGEFTLVENFTDYLLIDIGPPILDEEDDYYMPGNHYESTLSMNNILDEDHPIMENVDSFTTHDYYFANPILQPETSVIAEYTTGIPLVVVKENVGPLSARRVFLNFYPVSTTVFFNPFFPSLKSWNAETDGAILMANALKWASFPSSPSEPEYCSSYSTRNRFEWIKHVDIQQNMMYYDLSPSDYEDDYMMDEIDNLTNAETGGYGDYTTQVLDVHPGSTISVSLTPGYKRRAYKEFWRIWADWNYDGDFDDVGEKVFEKSGKNIQTGSFMVPYAASSNELRLRVSMRWKKYAPSCGNYSNGEVEDYSVRMNNLELGKIAHTMYVPLSNDEDISYVEESFTELTELNANPVQTGEFISGIVRVSDTGTKMFYLRNALGQMVKSVQINCSEEESVFELSTDRLKSGVYFLNVDNDKDAMKVLIY